MTLNFENVEGPVPSRPTIILTTIGTDFLPAVM